MKYLALRLAVSLFTFAVGVASFGLLRAPVPAASPEDERAVLLTERQYIRANLDGDTATLDTILADEFVFRSRRGISTKADRLDLLADPNFNFESINTGDVEVEVEGHSATVTGKAVATSRSYGQVYTSPLYRFTRKYEKRDGRWQIVSVFVSR